MLARHPQEWFYAKPVATIGETFEIDQKALHRVADYFPPTWLRRKQDPDVHIDYMVEIVENGEPTGRHFGIQIKGTRQFKENTSPSHSFKTKHLRYYIEKCRYPVFLFLVDVSKGNICWLFAQRSLRESQRTSKIRGQKSIVLQFTTGGTFEEFSRMLPDAERYMRELHPGPVRAALQRAREELMAKDPRVSVEIVANGNGETVILKANEEFPLQLRIRAESREESKRRMRDLIDRGTEITVCASDVAVSGSPLIEEMVRNTGQGTLRLKWGTKVAGSLEIALDGCQNLIHIEGSFSSGQRFSTFEGGWPLSPLKITFEIPANGDATPIQVQFHFRFKNWVGHPVLFLPYYDRFEVLASILVSDTPFALQIFVQGNVLGRARGRLPAELATSLTTCLKWIQKLRRICTHFKLNPNLPEMGNIPEHEWLDVERLFDLLEGREVREGLPNVKIALLVEGQVPPDAWDRSSGPLRIETEWIVYLILGHKMQIGPVDCHFSHMALAKLEPAEGGGTSVEFEGAIESERVMRLKQLPSIPVS